jgi:hypothetical protein
VDVALNPKRDAGFALKRTMSSKATIRFTAGLQEGAILQVPKQKLVLTCNNDELNPLGETTV